jgi:hypothetical protein
MIRLTHPDLGGSAASFRSVQDAWDAILAERASTSNRQSDPRRREEEAARRRRTEWAAEQEARRAAEEWRMRTVVYLEIMNDLPRRYQRWVRYGAGIGRARAWRRFDLIASVTEMVLVLGGSLALLTSVRYGTTYVGIDLLAVLLVGTAPLLAVAALVEFLRMLSRRAEVRRDPRPHLSPDEVFANTPQTRL